MLLLFGLIYIWFVLEINSRKVKKNYLISQVLSDKLYEN
jgi:hypothetical protein